MNVRKDLKHNDLYLARILIWFHQQSTDQITPTKAKVNPTNPGKEENYPYPTSSLRKSI